MKKPLLLSLLVIITLTTIAQDNCLEFDGSNDYVNVPDDNSLDLSSQFSIEFWIMFYQDAGKEVICKSNSDEDENFRIYCDPSTEGIYFDYGDGDDYTATSSFELDLNTWYHMCFTISAGSGGKIYVNGDEALSYSSQNSAQNPIPVNNHAMEIGGVTVPAINRYTNGKIDELRIWNDIRTETEIRQNMYRELSDPSSESNLAAYYKFNSTSGTTVTDSKGSNDGILTNMNGDEWKTSSAIYGPKNCLDFDGTDDDVEISDNNSLDLTTDYTLEAWINTDNLSGTQGVISKYHTGAANGYMLRLSNNGAVQFDELNTTDNVITTGKWYHIAAVSNNRSRTLYINGNEVSFASGSALYIVANSDPVRIGQDYASDNNRFFDGKIDEVRIWNDARTKEEIIDNMCKNLTGNETGLVSYYTFDNSSGTALQDFALNDESQNDGTLNNMDNSDWISSSAYYTWLNTNSSNWDSGSNWSTNSEPGENSNIGIYNFGGTSPIWTTQTYNIGNLVLGQSASLTLSNQMFVSGNLILENNLDINGQNITLNSEAILIENQGLLYGASGEIATTRELNNITSENVAGIGAEITTSANLSYTYISRYFGGSKNPDPAPIDRIYRVNPTNNSGLNATLVFHYSDDELNNLDESELELYKSSDNISWALQSSSSVNTSNNTITLTGIDGFSWWTASDGSYVTGNTLNFDGSDDYVDCGSGLNISGTNISIEAWIYPTDLKDASYKNTIIGNDYWDGVDNEGYVLRFGGSTGDLDFTMSYDCGTNTCWKSSSVSNVLTENVWQHVAATYDGSNVILYVNGEKVLTDPQTTSIVSSPANALIGASPGDIGNRLMVGRIDELRVWNDTRTETEISDKMCQTLIGNEANLVAYYRFNETSANTTNDGSTNGNDGTIQNFDWESTNYWLDSEAFTTWTGNSSTSWNDSGNWTDGEPGSTDNVGITNQSNDPVINSAINVNNLVVADAASVTFNSTGHTIHGSVFNIGTTNLEANTDLTITGSLYVLPLSTVNIKSLAELTIEKNLDLDFLLGDGTLNLLSDATGTGSMIVEGLSSGDIVTQRYVNVTGKGDKWHYVSSPVSGQAIDATWLGNNSISSDPAYQFFRFDEPTNYWIIYGSTGNPAAFNDTQFGDAKGYCLTRSAAGSLSFTGSVRTDATTSYSASYNSETGMGYNLIGNPYTSSIGITADATSTNNFLAVNSDILDDNYEAIYIWDEQADWSNRRNDYRVISNASIQGFDPIDQDYIQPGQAFMVKVTYTDDITFNENMQAHNNDSYFKDNNEIWPSIEIIAQNDELFNSTAIGFNEGMTTGLDPSYDVGKLKGNPDIAIYTRLVEDNGIDFAIQALDAKDIESYVIPLGVDVTEENILEFSISQTNLDKDVYLEDRLLNTSVNLSKQNYTANVTESGVGRFYVHFVAVGIEEEVDIANPVQVYSSGNTLTIINNQNLIGDIALINIIGQQINTYKLDGNPKQIIETNFPSGIYIVYIKNDNGITCSEKVFVR